MTPVQLALIAVFAPLLSATLLMLVPGLRRLGKPAAGVSMLGAAASLVASVLLLTSEAAETAVISTVRWLPGQGQTLADIGVHLDGISISMLGVVGVVALCVQVFSFEYMSDETPADFGRYYTWQSLFLFSMQALVIAPNLLQLFMAWELVGLCSYLLIGYWWTKPSAAQAAVKAFWMTKLADMGFLLGLILQYVTVGDFGFDAGVSQGLAAGGALGAVTLLYFFAVMGKSAQFPLHIWLPDAMEGPTPVSALLHAATMVAAGVFLIVRAYPLFGAAHSTLVVMAVIGGFTAFAAACMAIVQTDIKKVLAYSTCSQLGYMVAALGAGSLMAGYFHLTTHAFFKALLFLAAGSVIHSVHSNELSNMGGLAKKMKITSAAFIIGSIALAGLPFLSGFYSKDLILETLFHQATLDPIYWVPFVFATITAGLTAYYMARVVFLAFFGEESEAASHAHESGPMVLLPLVLLSVLAISVGWAGGQLAHLYGDSHYHFAFAHFTPVGIGATTLALCGILAAWLLHVKGVGTGLLDALAPVGEFIRFGPVNRGWEAGYRQGMLVFSAGLGWFDRYVIDALVNWTGVVALKAGEDVREFQTGRVNDYVYVVVGGVIALAAVTQILGSFGGGL